MAGWRRKRAYGGRKPRGGRAKRLMIALVAAALLAALAWGGARLAEWAAPWVAAWRGTRVGAWQETQLAREGLNAYFLDVGQADAAILTCGGAAVVIDGGNVDDADAVYSMLHDTLGVTHIDAMIASHPHEDHVGGLSGAIRACTVGTFYAPVLEADNRPFEISLEQARDRGARIVVPKPGESFQFGGARVEFLGPLHDYEYVNDMSIVCRVTYGETALLFGGDAGWEPEKDLVNAGVELAADVLKVNHHGSNWSSSKEFLRAVRPRWAVITAGEGGDANLPSPRVVERLRDLGATVLRTDECGTICISTDGEKITISQFGKES